MVAFVSVVYRVSKLIVLVLTYVFIFEVVMCHPGVGGTVFTLRTR